jgi:nicotinamidase-related amidase
VTESSTDRAALLVLHVQPPITDMTGDPALVGRIANAVRAAREAGLLVVYVNIGFRPGYPELSADDPLRAILEPGSLMIAGTSNAVHPDVAPRPDDLQVTTPRNSAFSGTDLEMLLRHNRIDSLILTGISTGGVVLGTLTEADDRNYEVTVLSDAVGDPDPEVHRVLLGLFPKPPRKARVLTTADWSSTLPAAAAVPSP